MDPKVRYTVAEDVAEGFLLSYLRVGICERRVMKDFESWVFR